MEKIIILGCGYIGTNIANFIKSNYNIEVYVWGLNNEYVSFLKEDIIFIDKYSEEIDDSDKELFRNAIVVDALGNINATNAAQNVNFLVLQNCESKFNLINKLLKFEIKKYIYLSSGGTVYSDSELKHEESEKIEPLSIYALEKCIIENYLKIISMENQAFSYLILRLSNPYGGVCTKNKKQGIVDVSINKIMNNETLELYGELSNIRDYIFIDNVSEYLYKLGISNKRNEIFNIGSGVGTSIKEIIESIERKVEKKLKIDIQLSKTTNIKCNILNVNKLKSVVELEQVYTIEDGINKIINSLNNK